MAPRDAVASYVTQAQIEEDLLRIGLTAGDGVFVHASLRAIGAVIGGPRAVVAGLMDVVGPQGLVGMPAFSGDAYFPENLDRSALTEAEIAEVERAVLGFDPERSPTFGMGAIAETFRTWPSTERSHHPNISICLNGPDATPYLTDHPMAWATGPDAPLGRLYTRPNMKMLLIGVGWNRCTALHTAESWAETKRTKIRRYKSGPGDAPWVEQPDVADDLGRLFPSVGVAFEETGAVTDGTIGAAPSKLCDYKSLMDFATPWIDAANRASGDRH